MGARWLGSEAGKTTHFGFRDVDEDAKKGMVGEVFHRVADKYDLMNDVMSASLHRLWKDEFVAMLGPVPSPGESMPSPLAFPALYAL
jgi:hypothetical protein